MKQIELKENLQIIKNIYKDWQNNCEGDCYGCCHACKKLHDIDDIVDILLKKINN